MIRRRSILLFALLASALLTSAHVGDNNTHFRGSAGPWTVQVVIRHPGVVPGLAQITVRVEEPGVRSVSVRPVRWDVGLAGSPRPDPATPLPGDPQLFAAELWFMTAGSYSIYVDVDGDAGAGMAVVPVTSVATRQLAMGPGLGFVLVLLGLVLAAGLVSIVRAAVREAVLPPGMPATSSRRRRTRIATAVAIVGIVVLLSGGRAWWRAEAGLYRSNLHEPLDVATEVRSDATGAELRLILIDPRWLAREWSPLVPDHGKLMHAFLVRAPDLDVFAHLHPHAPHADSFRIALPPLPPGEYRLYADVVHESGFAQTLTDTITLPPLPASGDSADLGADADDAWWTGDPPAAPEPGHGTLAVIFNDGSALAWVRPERPIAAGQPVDLRFVARRPDGSPAAVEPYMGMYAHAVVTRPAGDFFVHMHPAGSISMAAQQALLHAEPQTSRVAVGSAEAPPGITVAALPEDTAGAAPASKPAHDAHPQVADSTRASTGTVSPQPTTSDVVIPYSFPDAGQYRLWVQVKIDGVIRTAAFDVNVVAGM